MDALRITDVSAQTVVILFLIVGAAVASVLAGVLIAFGWALRCIIKRMVERSMTQSKTNHAAICEHGDAIKKLTERIDAQQKQLDRIEQALPKRRVR